MKTTMNAMLAPNGKCEHMCEGPILTGDAQMSAEKQLGSAWGSLSGSVLPKK